MPPNPNPAGIEAVYLANREKLLRFLRARGAGENAEDILQDLWLKITKTLSGPVSNPAAYLFRAADTLMIDRFRAQVNAERRESDWAGSRGEEQADLPADRTIAARQETAQVNAVLAALGSRRETVFRRARIDGVSQPRIAAELGVSLSTVESDLRVAAKALAELMERLR
jgi:RNA polymerase sigma factor (sigma-70 family)